MAEANSPEPNGKVTPPYLAYRTLKNFLDSLKRGIPARIDRSVLNNLSGGAQSMLIGALRFFELIGPDGTPRNTLEGLVQADGETRNKLMQEMLMKHYPFIFSGGFKLQSATPKQVREAFDAAYGQNDTARKAMVFFLLAAKEAGMQMSPYLKVREVSRPTRRRGNGKPAPADSTDQGDDNDDDSPGDARSIKVKSPYEMLIEILDTDAMEEEEQKAVWTLLKYLKKREAEG